MFPSRKPIEMILPDEAAPSPGRRRTRRFSSLLISVCFGLLIGCGMFIGVLLLQIKDLKVESAAKDQLIAKLVGNIENKAAPPRKTNYPNDAPKQQVKLNLTQAEVALIRKFIMVPTMRTDEHANLDLYEKVSNRSLAYLPSALVEEMPKLQGLKFFVGPNGAIVLVDERNDRIQALVGGR